jgi:hypothetical protein
MPLIEQEITEVRPVAATYQRRAIQLHKTLGMEAGRVQTYNVCRGTYTQLLSQMPRAVECRKVELNGRPKNTEASMLASVSPLLQPASLRLWMMMHVSVFCPYVSSALALSKSLSTVSRIITITQSVTSSVLAEYCCEALLQSAY